jgi:5-formyltetrahydrofolate cyclo-ligase
VIPVPYSITGYRIGKGKGYADLEFAMMMKMEAVNQNTTIVTTVHDCQVRAHASYYLKSFIFNFKG